MQIKLSLLSLALFVSSALSKPVHTICGNDAAVDASVEKAVAARVSANRSAGRLANATERAAVSVPVYWHVITDGSTGRLSSTAIQNSISVLNNEYAEAGYTFRLAGSETTVNSNWFNNVNQGTSAEASMKNSLRKGGPEALNVYTVQFSGGLLGYATFPWSYSSAPKNDGIVLQWSTYPNGPLTSYNTGKVLVHEAGHWFGLYHVFQGGCSGTGDGVADTPPQSKVTSGCPASQDSCAGGGVDSIHNHLDYSVDSCRTEFTPGQVTRMNDISDTYRF
ncbi:hypothetical protein ACQY0O_004932 [Thecaphora frezii]|nr:putative zincin [Thecaphora frezii]